MHDSSRLIAVSSKIKPMPKLNTVHDSENITGSYSSSMFADKKKPPKQWRPKFIYDDIFVFVLVTSHVGRYLANG